MTDDFRQGDIILYRDVTGGLGQLTTEFQDSPYIHSEIYYQEGITLSAEIHRYLDGVQAKNTLLTKATNEPGRSCFDLFRLRGGLSDEQARLIREFALRQLGKPFAAALLAIGIPYWSPKHLARYLAQKSFICSQLVTDAYEAAGIELFDQNFLNEQIIPTPGDLGTSLVLEYIGTWQSGKWISAQPNIEFPGAKKSVFLKILGTILLAFSNRVEFNKQRELFWRQKQVATGLPIPETKGV